MEKNYLDGVVPPAQKRSIRDIPVPPRNRPGRSTIKKMVSENEPSLNVHKKKTPNEEGSIPATPPESYSSGYNNTEKRTGGGSRSASRWNKRNLIIIGVGAALLLLFVILSSFDSATLTLQAKTVDFSVNKNLEIGDLSSSVSSYDVGYRTIELAKEVELEVEANSEEFVQQNASGIITILNEYSTEKQNLIKNTRFESPNGLIYKIEESVSVPGYTGSGDSKVAGQIDVKVVAAEPGENYNVESTTFTIPGFKGQEPYDFFSAKSKTAITGGFDGVRKIVSDENISTASIELKNSVTNILIDELKQQVTDEFIAVYNEDSFTYLGIEQEDALNGENVILKLKGEIVAKVFNKIDLSNAVALDTINEYTLDQDVLIKNIEEAALVISNETVTQEIEDDEGEISEINTSTENIHVSGNLVFVWQNDTEEIKADLIGVSKNELGSVMKNYVGVSRAEAVIKPFWRSKFPTDVKNIKIVFVEN